LVLTLKVIDLSVLVLSSKCSSGVLPVSLKGKPRAGSRQGLVNHRFCAAWENHDRRKFAASAWYPAAIAAFGKICRDALGKKRHTAMALCREMPAIPRKKLVHGGTLKP